MVEMTTPFDTEPRLTPSQREAILRNDHTLIAAGAGSGKTTTLVDKILYALGADRVPGHTPRRVCELREIAAITFTNAAAADLKRKLRKRLGKIARWHATHGNIREAAIWRDRVYEVDRSRIGTIHSFCGDILREFALQIGMDPGFAVLDEGEASELRAECVTAALDRALVERASVMSLVDHLTLRRTEEVLAQLAARPDLLPEIRDAWVESGALKVSTLRALVMASRGEWGCEGDAGMWRDGPDELSARLCAELFELAALVREATVDRLDGQSVLDFDEMILRTQRVLENNASVRMAVRRSLAWLFIDEFQDTDRAQLAIANLISGFGEPPSAANPSLCIVGDPKQSIYRFRRADVSLWSQTEAAFRAQGIEAIKLDTNFRSVAPIVGFVNATFSGLIGHAPQPVLDCGHDIEYSPLLSHRGAHETESAVELLVIPPHDGKAGERRDAEYDIVAARLFELVGREKIVWDEDAGEHRAARWGDIAILVRARTPLRSLEEAFRAHGVPYYMSTGDGFFARREVVDVRLLLAALADRQDDVAWLGLLRSPLVGLTDEAILRARIAEARSAFSRVLYGPCADADRPTFERARTFTERLSHMRDRVTVAELIDYALRESGYGAYVLTQPDGELAAMNLRKLVQMADGRRADTVSDFLEFLETRERSSREGDAQLFTADEDVVTVTTVHSAKGLEWPIVFLVDLGRDVALKAGRTSVHADAEAGVALHIEVDGVVPGAWEYMTKRERELTLAEEKRLWYVAATRPRDKLILCGNRDDIAQAATFADGSADAPPKHVKDWLFRGIRTQGDALTFVDDGTTYQLAEHVPAPHVSPTPAEAPLPSIAQLAAARVGIPAAVISRVVALPLTRSLPRYSATQLKTFDDDPKQYERVYVYGVADERVSSRDGGNAPQDVPARILGDVLHGALERDRDDEDLLLYIEAELSSRLGEDTRSPRVQAATKRVRQLVEQSRKHPAVARLYDCAESERELPFTWFVRDGERTSVVIGAMDLVAVVDARPEILDFKSHKLAPGREEATAATYGVQLQVYSAAFAAVSGTAPGRFTFFFPETATPVERAIDQRLVATSTMNVQALIARMAEAVR